MFRKEIFMSRATYIVKSLGIEKLLSRKLYEFPVHWKYFEVPGSLEPHHLIHLVR